jgi:hypothetical protein
VSDRGRGGSVALLSAAAGAVGAPAFVVFTALSSPASAQTFCSVFDDRPCAPSFCSVFGPIPCIPEVVYPPGQDLRLTVRSRLSDDHRPVNDSDELNSLRDLFGALRACWTPPALDEGRAGMEVSIRLSFNRFGNIIGSPRFTYTTREASGAQRDLYRRAVVDSLSRCTPLPLSKGLGGAIAGRPIAIRYVDDRTYRRTGG